MELRHLRYFVAVAEEQNVTRAAARLHVSQPPLTRQIQDLEAELGVSLFERTARTIRLTELGRLFLKEARAALQRVDQAVLAVRKAAMVEASELHVGHAPSATADFLPGVLRAFQRKLPGVRVTLHDMTASEILEGLGQSRLDAGFLVKPECHLPRGLGFQPLRRYPVMVAVARTHPWARLREIDRKDVLREPLVAYSRREYPNYHRLIARALGSRIHKLPLAQECDSGPSLIAAVKSGLGVCVVPSFIATNAGNQLRLLRLSPEPPDAIVGICHREDRQAPALQVLIESALAIRGAAAW